MSIGTTANLGYRTIDSTLTFYLQTMAVDTPTDPTGDPPYSVYEVETGTAIVTGTLSKLDDAGTIGFFSESLTLSAANGYEVDKDYCIRATWTVGLNAQAALYTFRMGPAPADVERISGDTTAADNLETMLDGTGGQALTLGQLRVNSSAAGGAVDIDNSAGPAISARTSSGVATESVSTGGNGAGIAATGNGTGEGIISTGGGTGAGIRGIGGSTSGDGLRAEALSAGGGNSHGINAIGAGTGAGMLSTGGFTGNGIRAMGGSTSGDGIHAEAATSGDGIDAVGKGTGHGVLATGGATNGDGINAAGGATNGRGIMATGAGTGAGLRSLGGATGHGFLAEGGATSGDGIHAEASTLGDGIDGVGKGTAGIGLKVTGGTNAAGLSAIGAGTGQGILATGGATGDGIRALGGSTSGDGLHMEAQTSGDGLQAVGAGGGLAYNPAIGTPGENANAVWDEPTAEARTAGSYGQLIKDDIDATISSRASAAALAVVQADTDDIQTRLPATLVGGRMRSHVEAMDAGVITAAVIATDAIDADAIAANAIDAAAIADGAIDAATFAAGAINAAAIADGAIDAATFAAGAIDATAIATNAIDADALAADAVGEIADGVWDEDIVASHGGINTSGQTLSQLTKRSAILGTDVVDGSVVGQMLDDGTAVYDRTTDSLQAIRDALPAAGPSAGAVADAVWDELTAGHNISGTFGQVLFPIRAGTAQAGAAVTITLDAGASAVDDFYNGSLVFLTGGAGALQARSITDYVGATKVATVSPAWATNPDVTSVFVVLPASTVTGSTSTPGDIADAVWDELRAEHVGLGSFGEYVLADIVRISGDVTAADNVEAAFETGGANTVTMRLAQLSVVNSGGDAIVASSTGGNGHGVNASGNGSGDGIRGTGGATNDSTGIRGTSAATNGFGIQGVGLGTRSGIRGIGGATGHGIHGFGGATSGHGILGQGNANGSGLRGIGGGTAGNSGIVGESGPTGNGIHGFGDGVGNGILAVGGATGHGAQVAGGATSGHGLAAVGQGAGHGILAQGGATSGIGILAKAQANNDRGMSCEANGSGAGFVAAGGTGGGDGLAAVGNGVGAGLRATGGATGDGIRALGGSTSGDGLHVEAQTAGDGLQAVGAGGGLPYNPAIGTPGDNADAVWDEATAGHLISGTFGQTNNSIRAGTAQAGGGTTITLDAGASAIDDFYNFTLVFVTGGTGAGQSRMISDYVGATKVATVNAAWGTNPDGTSVFVILPFGSIPGVVAPSAADNANAVWDELTAEGRALGSYGQLLKDDIDATISSRASAVALAVAQADLDNIQTRLPAGLNGGRMSSHVEAMDAAVVNQIVDQTWDEILAGHLNVGSTGEALNDAAAGGGGPGASAAAVADAVWEEQKADHEGATIFGNVGQDLDDLEFTGNEG